MRGVNRTCFDTAQQARHVQALVWLVDDCKLTLQLTMEVGAYKNAAKGQVQIAEFLADRLVLTCEDAAVLQPLGQNALAHSQAMLGSYWGHFAHAQSVRLRRALFEQFARLKSLFVLHPDGQLGPRWALQDVTFAGQASVLQAGWPQAVSIFQLVRA